MDVDALQSKSWDAPEPHDFLWFPDGNVVLATDSLLFKVHKSLLSLHSSVFRDMFELQNVGGLIDEDGVAAGDTYDGLPLVKLVGDNGEDVVHILRAIYTRRYYDHRNDKTPLYIVTALLTLSTKYDFKDIRQDVISQISRHYPMDLSSYDAVNNDRSSLFGIDRARCHGSLLVAASTAGVDCLLPSLFFASSDKDIRGVLAMDQTLSLSPECYRIMIKGRVLFEFEFSKLVVDLPEDLVRVSDESKCSCATPCLRTARYTGLAGLINVSFASTRGRAIVEDHLSPICGTCRSIVAHRIEKKRKEIWDKIPSFFGLSGWSFLRKQLREIIEPPEEESNLDPINDGVVSS